MSAESVRFKLAPRGLFKGNPGLAVADQAEQTFCA
jgi:Cu2+-containing amine oxidase